MRRHSRATTSDPTGNDAHRLASSVAFSPDGTRIVSGSADGTLKVWDEGEPSKGYDAMVAEWQAKLPPDDEAAEPAP